jgi:hypothetical protein
MKLLVFVFCGLLALRFVWDFSRMSKSKDATTFTRGLMYATFDAVVIILFAIIEKGRW